MDKAETIFFKLASLPKRIGKYTALDILQWAHEIEDPLKRSKAVKKVMRKYPELRQFKMFTGKASPGTVYGKKRTFIV